MSIVVDSEQFLEDSLGSDEELGDMSVDEETSEEVLDELEAQVSEVPSKFRDKSIDDVIKSYKELEKELGRKNNEVGELRNLTDDILKQQLEKPTEVKENQIDLDDFLENPNAAVTRAVDDNPRLARLEEQLKQAQIIESKKGFENKHPDWQSTLESEDFKEWVTGSSIRKEMFNRANSKFDYEMADELFGLYKDVRGVKKEQAEEKAATKRKKALKNTSVEKGSTGEVSKKVYRRTDLIRLKATNPDRYNDMGDEIMLAYQEGRIR